jgi:hypothetical protein
VTRCVRFWKLFKADRRRVEITAESGNSMVCIENRNVAQKFQSYPDDIRQKLMYLRELILDVASDTPEIGILEETLKWGEPSYLAKRGSTVRIDWKKSSPDHYAIYFNCNTKLVDTFKEIYSDLFNFDGNRAIVFHEKDPVPAVALKHCIELSLRYHSLKHRPLLGL